MKPNAMTAPVKTPTGTKHEELTRQLRLLAQSLVPGDKFPSQNELMRQFGVSDRTVLRSLDDLRRDGWIVRKNGSGTFVADTARHASDNLSKVTATETLAVLALANNHFFRYCVDELTHQATAQGLRVVCQYANQTANLADAVALEALHPAGFLIFSHGLVEVAQTMQERGHRVVLVGVPPQGVLPPVPCVFGDHDYGASLAARHLLDLGHRRIAYAHRHPSEAALKITRRWHGYQRTLAQAGIASDVTLGTETFLRWRENPDEMRAFFAAPDAPTALSVWTDSEAVEWITLLRGIGMSVPADISLIGYDNILPVGAHSNPPLDSIEPYIAVQVRHALDLLTQSGGGGTTALATTPTLLTRASSARPAPPGYR